ncbi:MAG: hypothetical protein HZB76_07375 [Chlamydiae bacterium]|nr:hypothetical protein [Chlamydiota bacterium]
MAFLHPDISRVLRLHSGDSHAEPFPTSTHDDKDNPSLNLADIEHCSLKEIAILMKILEQQLNDLQLSKSKESVAKIEEIGKDLAILQKEKNKKIANCQEKSKTLEREISLIKIEIKKVDEKMAQAYLLVNQKKSELADLQSQADALKQSLPILRDDKNAEEIAQAELTRLEEQIGKLSDEIRLVENNNRFSKVQMESLLKSLGEMQIRCNQIQEDLDEVNFETKTLKSQEPPMKTLLEALNDTIQTLTTLEAKIKAKKWFFQRSNGLDEIQKCHFLLSLMIDPVKKLQEIQDSVLIEMRSNFVSELVLFNVALKNLTDKELDNFSALKIKEILSLFVNFSQTSKKISEQWRLSDQTPEFQEDPSLQTISAKDLDLATRNSLEEGLDKIEVFEDHSDPKEALESNILKLYQELYSEHGTRLAPEALARVQTELESALKNLPLINQILRLNSLKRLTIEIMVVKIKLAEIESSISEDCQMLRELHNENLKELNQARSKLIMQKQYRFEACKRKFDSHCEDMKIAQITIERTSSEIQKCDETIKSLNDKKQTLETSLSSLKDESQKPELQKVINSFQIEIDQAQNEINDLNKILEEARKSFNQLTMLNTNLKNEIRYMLEMLRLANLNDIDLNELGEVFPEEAWGQKAKGKRLACLDSTNPTVFAVRDSDLGRAMKESQESYHRWKRGSDVAGSAASAASMP